MISIIIPTYNRACLIERAIKSVCNQTQKNWELVIVDDGSTDKTTEVLQPYLKDSRIRYIEKKNTGAAHSRNVGAENSTGEYIIFLDSDDSPKNNWLEEFSKVINEYEAKIICCGFEKLDHNGNLITTELPREMKGLFPGRTGLFIGGTFCLEKAMFTMTGGYDVELRSGQHTELLIRLMQIAGKQKLEIYNIFKPLIEINIHLGDRIRTNYEAKYLGSRRTLEKHEDFFKSRRRVKALYEGIVAANALKTGKKKEAITYALQSFRSKPSFKRGVRSFYYCIKFIG